MYFFFCVCVFSLTLLLWRLPMLCIYPSTSYLCLPVCLCEELMLDLEHVKSRALRLKKNGSEVGKVGSAAGWYIIMLGMNQDRLWRDTAHDSADVRMRSFQRNCLRAISERKGGKRIYLPGSFLSREFHSVWVCIMAGPSLANRRNEVKTKCRSNHWRTGNISNTTKFRIAVAK